MSWKIRHEGSPKSVEVKTLQQVVDGLQDGRWEPTDEVMGPQDRAWVAIENHPQLAEIALDLEPPPPREQDDETRLDMNALIDVCLVLLVFFILTTTYAELQKMLDSPNLAPDADQKLPVVTRQQVEQSMIQVTVKETDKGPVIRVEGQEVEPDQLVPVLKQFVGPHKVELLLDHDRAVPHGTIVAIEDAAKSAHIDRVLIAIPKEELKK
jgi:biopolymer transport protein ExbD